LKRRSFKFCAPTSDFKIRPLRTLVDIAPGLPVEEKAELNKSLRELADYSASRNMIAHDPFRPNSAATGVEFLTVKAKGRFELPSVVWNADRFQQEGATVDQYRALLDGLRDRFRIRPLGPESFVQDHMPWTIPMQRTVSPVLMHYLFHQAQDDLVAIQPCKEQTLKLLKSLSGKNSAGLSCIRITHDASVVKYIVAAS
jgi:hypothetical protein